jgi:hypothetical protein
LSTYAYVFLKKIKNENTHVLPLIINFVFCIFCIFFVLQKTSSDLAWLAPRDWTIPTFLLAELQSSTFCPFLTDANDGTGRRVYCFDGYANEKLVVFSAFRSEFMHPRDLMGLVRSQRAQEWYAPGCAPMVLSHTHVVLVTDTAPGAWYDLVNVEGQTLVWASDVVPFFLYDERG